MRRPILVTGLLVVGVCVAGAAIASASGKARTRQAVAPTAVTLTNTSGVNVGNVVQLDPGMLEPVTLVPGRNTVQIDPHANTVNVQNTDPNGNIKVHEQGTANVNVVNSKLPSQTPVTGGGGSVHLAGSPATQSVSGSTSFIELRLTSGVASVEFSNNGTLVLGTFGPTVGANAVQTLALPRPISFTAIKCMGLAGDQCYIYWEGNSP